jgi:hypothetical protein
MSTYVYRNGALVDKATGEPMPLPATPFVAAPLFMKDSPGCVSPIDGTWLEGRAARREHMKVHDVVEVGDRKPREFRSEAFALRHGFRP